MARAHLYGTPVSPGISLGTLHFLHSENFVDRRSIKPEEAAREQATKQAERQAQEGLALRMLQNGEPQKKTALYSGLSVARIRKLAQSLA